MNTDHRFLITDHWPPVKYGSDNRPLPYKRDTAILLSKPVASDGDYLYPRGKPFLRTLYHLLPKRPRRMAPGRADHLSFAEYSCLYPSNRSSAWHTGRAWKDGGRQRAGSDARKRYWPLEIIRSGSLSGNPGRSRHLV